MNPLPLSSPSTFVAPIANWGIVTCEGPDAATFLHGQLSTAVKDMAVGAAGWSSYNSPKGRMLATLLLWRRGADTFAAFVAADLAEALVKRLRMFVLRAKVTVTDDSAASRRFGVGGSEVATAVSTAWGEAPAPGQGCDRDGVSLVRLPDGRTLVQAPIADADDVWRRLTAVAQPVAEERWDWTSVCAGVPHITRATQDLFVPQTANFDLIGGLDFHKGCYPGQEIVARMQYLGRLKERLFAFHVTGEVPAPGAPLFNAAFGEQACGTVVNAAPTPNGGADLLAVVYWSALDTGPLHVGAADGRTLSARALPYEVPLPVAPNRPRLG
jgi:folate-binding protein YgfZ